MLNGEEHRVDFAAPIETRTTRGRVVMLVDNGVNGDSRVQKAAASAAEAGWEVILLGRSPDTTARSWKIGQAEVRLIPMPSPLTKRSFEFRRSWLRAPLAYPPTGIAAYRAQKVRAWQADLTARRAELTVNFTSDARLRLSVRRRALRGQSVAAHLVGRWVSLRSRQLSYGQKARRRMNGPWDRAYAFFWRTVQGDRSWRRLEPRLWDFELAFGKVIDQLKPDLIHANDFYMLGVGARAMLRARAAKRPVKLVWDAHELVSGLKARADNIRWLPAHVAHEREYARYADAAITVSDGLATALQRAHRLPVTPSVVLNAPVVERTDADEPAPDIRALCGVNPDDPLLVYSGAAAPQRGVGLMIEALPHLPGVHVALVVAQPPSKYVQGLLTRAGELGVADRVHTTPYVNHRQVIDFLAGADVGVIPIHHWPNHEIALITKFMEYSHARLPIVVSDVKTMAETTRATGQGEVFRAEDLVDYVRAVKAVLAHPERYRAAYETPGLLENWTWEAQASILDDVYSRLVPDKTRIRASVPDVSVVISVHNAMPYLPKCLYSLVGQSIGLDSLEIVAVDDGSTDESRERLDRFSRAYRGTFKIIKRDGHSGGDAMPLNLGLEAATGRYVLFLAPDDYLAPEALERMVAAADENASDVVVPRAVDAKGRPTSRTTFSATELAVDPYTSPLPFVVSGTALYRRELIARHGLRHREDVHHYAELLFALQACVLAERVTALAEHDHHYAVRRRGGAHLATVGQEARQRCLETVFDEVAYLLEPGERRDAIAHRVFAVEMDGLLGDDFAELPRPSQESIVVGIGRLADRYLTEGVRLRLDVATRLRMVLAQRGHVDALADACQQDGQFHQAPVLAEDEHLYIAYPGFRDTRLALPDDLFAITTRAAVAVAGRLTVPEVGWEVREGGRWLLVTISSTVDLQRFGPDPLRVHIGEIPGQVTMTTRESGTVARARFDVSKLIRQSVPGGGRLTAQVQLAGDEVVGAVALPGPEATAPRQICRHGTRPYRIRAFGDGRGQLVIEVAPVTLRRVVGRLRHRLGNRR